MGAQSVASTPVAKHAKRTPTKRQVVDLTSEEEDEEPSPQKKRKRNPNAALKASPKAEKRPRRWRSHAPTSYTERLERAMNQRMFVLDRERDINAQAPSEEITIAGTTGNLYTVTICTVPSCTCPDAAKGNQCKHIIYALTRILKVTSELRYQLSFLPAELLSIFNRSPLTTGKETKAAADFEKPNNRKQVSGDCPICFCEMEDDDPNDIVWCKAACGNNVHKTCFMQWAKSSKDSSGKVRCVYCRTKWESEGAVGADGWKGTEEELAALKANAGLDRDGYANIASQLGITGHRDYSSYHQPWLHRRSWDFGGSHR